MRKLTKTTIAIALSIGTTFTGILKCSGFCS